KVLAVAITIGEIHDAHLTGGDSVGACQRIGDIRIEVAHPPRNFVSRVFGVIAQADVEGETLGDTKVVLDIAGVILESLADAGGNLGIDRAESAEHEVGQVRASVGNGVAVGL